MGGKEEELRSTADSSQCSKGARMGSESTFTPNFYIKIFKQLIKARYMEEPYQSNDLVWENDQLWELILVKSNLDIKTSVAHLKDIVRHYQHLHSHDPLLPGVDNSSLRILIIEFFKEGRGFPRLFEMGLPNPTSTQLLLSSCPSSSTVEVHTEQNTTLNANLDDTVRRTLMSEAEKALDTWKSKLSGK